MKDGGQQPGDSRGSQTDRCQGKTHHAWSVACSPVVVGVVYLKRLRIVLRCANVVVVVDDVSVAVATVVLYEYVIFSILLIFYDLLLLLSLID